MSHAKLNSPTDCGDNAAESTFFRCPVPSEQAPATLRFAKTRIEVELYEAAVDGFSVVISAKFASSLRLGPRWILENAVERSEVLPQWIYCAPDGRLQIGLRRLRDLTREPKPSLLPRIGGRKREIDYSLVFAALVIVILVVLALPGIGDALGTAPWIERAIRTMLRGV